MSRRFAVLFVVLVLGACGVPNQFSRDAQVSSSFISVHGARSEGQTMKTFEGFYVGVSPTDESAVAAGEFSMEVGADVVTLRHAIRPRVVDEATIPLSDFRLMSEEEIFSDGVREGASGKYVGFVTSGGVQFIFTLKPSINEFDVFVRRGQLPDMLGPTILWSHRRIGRIFLLKMRLFLLNLQYKGGVPRL
jgi:hypothetical protein